jgi:tetratricopeptide (TPR) repeat protein
MRSLLTSLLLMLTLGVSAQELVKYEEISFSSDFEKRVFDDHFLNKKTDFFSLLMANGSLLNESSIEKAKTRFTNYIDGFKTEKFQSKKPDKKVKTLYDGIHADFFIKYEAKNRFENIFHNGAFNCVSASALFGLAFHELRIPFSIKEQPTHVYVIAFPSSERIMVETTTPLAGYYTVTEQFKDDYTRMLKDQKLITAKEYIDTDRAILFDKYYFGNQGDITLLQLVGLQYANDGLALLDAKEYLAAFNELEKAYLFYPSDRTGYLLMLAGGQAVQSRENKDSVHAQMVGKLSRYKRYGVTADMIKGELHNSMLYWLSEKGDKETMKSYFTAMHRMVDDKALKDDLEFNYSYECGRMNYNKAKFKDALPYFERCLTLKPNHAETTSIFVGTIGQSFKNLPTKEAIKMLEQYSLQFPSLTDDNTFNLFLCNAYLIESANGFKNDDPSTGEAYQSSFEKYFSSHSDVNPGTQILGEAYSSAAVYYFKKGQSSKARNAINEGLKISPENYQLKMSQRMLD